MVIAGKTSIVRALALLCNQPLVELALTAGSDTSDILGGFEQIEAARRIQVQAISKLNVLYLGHQSQGLMQ